MATKNPPKWHEVYPQGTQAGNEEFQFWVAIARHPKYGWRSVGAIEKSSGLPRKRVEELLQKYFIKGMVFPSPKNEENWGYWERVPEMLVKDAGSLAGKDQKKRIDKATGVSSGSGSKKASGSGNNGSGNGGSGIVFDDDDDDIQCKVTPMGGVPAGPASSFRLLPLTTEQMRRSRVDLREVACNGR